MTAQVQNDNPKALQTHSAFNKRPFSSLCWKLKSKGSSNSLLDKHYLKMHL